jgi:hypothetical protein
LCTVPSAHQLKSPLVCNLRYPIGVASNVRALTLYQNLHQR